VVINAHIIKLNLIVILATDVILLLIMSIGLLRLGFHERSAFGVGRLLWKQVGYQCLSLAMVYLLICCSPFARVSFGSWLPPSPRSCPQ
jgi:hypothetical protein